MRPRAATVGSFTKILAALAATIAVTGHTSRAGIVAQERPVSARAQAPPLLSAADRQALIAAIADKWAGHVEATFGTAADVWRARLLTSLARADAHNLREALSRDTYEGMLAALIGRGQQLTDASVLRAGAAVAPDEAARGSAAASRLGALTSDLTYTPLPPCRILDTRSTPAGAIAAGTTRHFIAVGITFAGQGGSATDCGTNGIIPTAVAINLTAVAPSGAGYATVFPYLAPQPLTASLNYGAGAIVNNALIAQIPNPLAAHDFSIYSFAQSHYVADLVGYFAPNIATPLECLQGSQATVDVAPGMMGFVAAPACLAGYTATGINCAGVTDMFVTASWNGSCSARNTDPARTQTLYAAATCCRVPGR